MPETQNDDWFEEYMKERNARLRAFRRRLKIGDLVTGWIPGFHKVVKIGRPQKDDADFDVTCVTIAKPNGDKNRGRKNHVISADDLTLVDIEFVNDKHRKAIKEADEKRDALMKMLSREGKID